MPDDDAWGGDVRLCRHIHASSVKLCLRYSLSDGTYVGEIDMAAKGDATVWQMLAYDLLAVCAAAVDKRAVPQPGEGDAAPLHMA